MKKIVKIVQDINNTASNIQKQTEDISQGHIVSTLNSISADMQTSVKPVLMYDEELEDESGIKRYIYNPVLVIRRSPAINLSDITKAAREMLAIWYSIAVATAQGQENDLEGILAEIETPGIDATNESKIGNAPVITIFGDIFDEADIPLGVSLTDSFETEDVQQMIASARESMALASAINGGESHYKNGTTPYRWAQIKHKKSRKKSNSSKKRSKVKLDSSRNSSGNDLGANNNSDANNDPVEISSVTDAMSLDFNTKFTMPVARIIDKGSSINVHSPVPGSSNDVSEESIYFYTDKFSEGDKQLVEELADDEATLSHVYVTATKRQAKSGKAYWGFSELSAHTE